jgi:predicted nucleotidyltransferase
MKIRIKGNAIRYRLTKTDVAGFSDRGFVEEKTEFPTGPVLHYRIERKAGITDMEASFAENILCVFIPEKIAEEWTSTDIVGFSHKVVMGKEKELFLLIEKDFVCLDDTDEDQDDNYPNPNKVC